MADDLTLQVLREIRDEIRTTRESLGARIDDVRDSLGSRIDATNERLDGVERGLLELAEQQRFVVRWLEGSSGRDRKIERRVASLEDRVDALERPPK